MSGPHYAIYPSRERAARSFRAPADFERRDIMIPILFLFGFVAIAAAVAMWEMRRWALSWGTTPEEAHTPVAGR